MWRSCSSEALSAVAQGAKEHLCSILRYGLEIPFSQTFVVSSMLLGCDPFNDQNCILFTKGKDCVLFDLVFQQVEHSE